MSFTYNTEAREPRQTISFPLVFPYEGYTTETQFSSSLRNTPFSFIKNAVFTPHINPITGKSSISVRQRAALNNLQDTATSSSGQDKGIFYWDKTGKIYCTFTANTYYSTPYGASTLLANNYTGGSTYNYAHYTEYFDGTNYYLATKKTNPTSKAYVIDTSNTLTEITDADYPNTTAVGQFVSLDGYLFVNTTSGKIYNSDLGAPTSWTSTNFITASISPDKGIGLAKYKNQLVVFGTSSIEFFYNAANPLGSPLARNEQLSISDIGCAGAKTIVNSSDSIFWISNSLGKVGVYMLDNGRPKKISTESIDLVIGEFSSAGDSMYAGKIHIAGVDCYYFSIFSNLPGVPTYIYNPNLDLWHIWTTEQSGNVYAFGTGSSAIMPSDYFPYISGISTIFPTIGLGTAERICCYLSSGFYSVNQDNISTGGVSKYVHFTIQSPPLDFSTHNFVRIHKIVIKMLINTGGTTGTIPINYTLNNLGKYQHPVITIDQANYQADVTVSVNGGTAKTIAVAADTPTLLDAEITYSICEH
jgi:hypothetical protein